MITPRLRGIYIQILSILAILILRSRAKTPPHPHPPSLGPRLGWAGLGWAVDYVVEATLNWELESRTWRNRMVIHGPPPISKPATHSRPRDTSWNAQP